MPTHAETKQATRDRILLAGTQVFTTLGLEAATIRDIVKLSGVAQGSFYNHFSTKDEVFDAVVEPLVAEVRARVAKAQDGARTAEAFVRGGFQAYLSVLSEHPGAIPLIERNLSRFRAHIEGSSSFLQLVEDIRQSLEGGQAKGMFRPFSCEWMAWCMVFSAIEVVLQAQRKGSLDADEITVFLEDLFLPAVRPL